jgi:hypothetical protein
MMRRQRKTAVEGSLDKRGTNIMDTQRAAVYEKRMRSYTGYDVDIAVLNKETEDPRWA